MSSRDGKYAQGAGMVLVRQRPGSANGVTFITLEDETGIANAIVWEKTFDQFRRVVLRSRMLLISGTIQREGDVVHLIARHLADLSPTLASVGEQDTRFPLPHGRGDDLHHGAPTPDPRTRPKTPAPRDMYEKQRERPGINPKTRDFR
jgi:error-prone DNA polymerase